MTKEVYTITGFKIASYFRSARNNAIMTTDPNAKYGLPDGSQFSTVNELEDWIIRMAEQIKSERQQIIINHLI